jgi:aspartate/methionine/tyrosine aminotransferase
MNDTPTPIGAQDSTPNIAEYVDELDRARQAMASHLAEVQRLDAVVDQKLIVLNGRANALAHAVKGLVDHVDLPPYVVDMVQDWDRANRALLAALDHASQVVAS